MTSTFAHHSHSLLRALVAAPLCLALLLGPASAAFAADAHQTVLEQTAATRGLALAAEVPIEFVDSGRVRTDIQAQTDRPDTRETLLVTQKLLEDLGLLSPDQNLGALLVGVYGEGVAGYYNRREKKMFVVGDAARFGPRERLTLSHEFTHALQDHHFDLGALTAAARADDDRSAALTALIEGDAVWSSVEYARAHFTDDDRRALSADGAAGRPSPFDSVPLVLRDELLFPYREGTAFVRGLVQQGGFAAVNHAFADPPRSTEHVLHPEKYTQRDQPKEVALPDLAAALGAGWARLRTNVLGELDYRILLQQYSDPRTAALGAAGWGGDRYEFLERPDGARLLVLRSTWDSEPEADQFFGAYLSVMQQRFGPAAAPQRLGPTQVLWVLPGGAVSLSRLGDRVDIVQAPDGATLQRTLELLATP